MSPIKAVAAKLQKVSLELADVNCNNKKKNNVLFSVYYNEKERLTQEFNLEEIFQMCVTKFLNQGSSLGLKRVKNK